jgi:DNA-binding transcriptional MerR regulator
MLKIGEFAALAQISIRMLRHYDHLGLLKPAYVDRNSDYRYYTLEQLPRLNRILALKDLGLTLGEIHLLLDEALTADEIRGILKLKQAQLHRRITEEQNRLQRVENRLHYIEQEGQLPEAEVVIKSQPAFHVISLTGFLGPERPFPRVFREAYTALEQHDLLQHVQGNITIYYGSMEYQRTRTRVPANWLVEAVYIMDEAVQCPIPLSKNRQMRVWDMPTHTPVASLISNKPDLARHLDVQHLWQWIFQHGYRLAAPVREIYLKRPGETDDQLTEIVFPIEPVSKEE